MTCQYRFPALPLAFVVAFGLFSSTRSLAEGEILTIEGARIRGNQELPTVLYVVPWQPPEVQRLETPETSFAVSQPLKSLERSQFKRLVSYHQHFLRKTQGERAGSSPEQDN